MKKFISCFLIACLMVANLNTYVGAETVIGENTYYSIEEATNIIDNLIVEGEGIDESHFTNQYIQDNPLCDAALWMKKLDYTRFRIHTSKEQVKAFHNYKEDYMWDDGFFYVHDNENNPYYYVSINCSSYSMRSNDGTRNKSGNLAGLYYYKIIFSNKFERIPIAYLYNMLKNTKEHNSLECYIWQKLMNYTNIPSTYITGTFNSYLSYYRSLTYENRDNSNGYTQNDLDKLKSLLLESFEIMLQEAEEPYLDTSPTAGVDITDMINAMKKVASTKKTNDANKSGSNNSTSKSGNKAGTKGNNNNNNNNTVNGLKKVVFAKVTAKKKQVTIKWNMVANAKKYEIQISTNKKFKNATIIKTKKTSKTIKKLKSNKKYYIRIRAINGKNKSKWVKKSIRTKK
ncbi:hypothetical protein [Eubacterium sp.]|uniref:fibronectin type III domain-containing protein n=1 Tax=Eubacterium sp. TaxID=142586 RepID=UPI0025E8D541|nr:hypothetical protein [Eubacterium sp.]MCR5629085.1 hypothetical protein [Eubacterium sp.]